MMTRHKPEDQFVNINDRIPRPELTDNERQELIKRLRESIRAIIVKREEK